MYGHNVFHNHTRFPFKIPTALSWACESALGNNASTSTDSISFGRQKRKSFFC